MKVRPFFCSWFVAALCLVQSASSALAARPSEILLPANTKGFLSVPNLDTLLANFNRSQLGQLCNDPVMQPFVDDFKRQLRSQGLKQLEQMSISWDELEGVPAGEVALAVIQPSIDTAAVALVIDVTGKQPQAEALLAKIATRMNTNGAKKIRRPAGDPIVAYQLSGEPGQKILPMAAYFMQGEMLVASDNLSVIEAMLAGMRSDRKDSLAATRAYREIMTKLHSTSAGLAPDARWFIEPFGYAETLRAAAPPREKRKGPDILKVLKGQGFTAVQGVGGTVNFAAGQHELLHRTMIYAPPLPGRTPQSKEKFNLAARMLHFPVGGDLLPQRWVPGDVSTYATFNWDMQHAFKSAETLVDDMVGEPGVFRDVLDSLRDDPDGPRVDIEAGLVANLGTRATIVTDYQLPIGPKSERKLFAAEIKDEKAVADTIRKLMEADKDAREREFEGITLWEIVDAEAEVPTLHIEAPGGAINHSDSGAPTEKKDDRLLPTSVIGVAHGQLFLASHIDMVHKVLKQIEQAEHLGGATDFQIVTGHAEALGAGPMSFRMFSRSDEELRPTYEMIRTGQMPQSESILGKVLNGVLGEGKEGVPRKQRIDGRQLPEFEAVRRYLGPGGMFITSHDDGWLLTGFTLARDGATGEPRVARGE